MTDGVTFDDSLVTCGLIAALLVLGAGDADETIGGATDCCFGMFDLSEFVRVGVVGLDFCGVATISGDDFKVHAPTGVSSLGIVVPAGGVILIGVLTRGATTGEAAPDAFKGLLLLRGVCFVRGDDAFGDVLTGVTDDSVSIVRGTVSFVSFDGSGDVFGFGEVCVGVETLIDISGGAKSITVELTNGDTIGLSTDCSATSRSFVVDFLGVSMVGLALAWLSRKALTFACDITLCCDCNIGGNAMTADAVAVLVVVTDCGAGGTEPTVLVFRIVEDGLFGLPGTTCEAVPAVVVCIGD